MSGATVRVVEPLMLPQLALIVVFPSPALVARPAVEMTAAVVADEPQTAEAVTFCVLPSLKLPVAVNCCMVPSAMDGFVGVIAMETSAAEVTVSVADPVTEPYVAVIVALPVATLVARPRLPARLLMVVTFTADEVHCAVLVMSWVVPFVKVPVAVNCWVAPRGMKGIAGVTAIADRTACVTVKGVDPVTDPQAALIVVVPVAKPVACPSLPGVSPTAATVFAEEAHCTVWVRSRVLPSVKVPVALNCCMVPRAIEEFAGVTLIEPRTGSTVRVAAPAAEPEAAVIVALPDATVAARPAALTVATEGLEDVQVAELVMF